MFSRLREERKRDEEREEEEQRTKKALQKSQAEGVSQVDGQQKDPKTRFDNLVRYLCIV